VLAVGDGAPVGVVFITVMIIDVPIIETKTKTMAKTSNIVFALFSSMDTPFNYLFVRKVFKR
jgi:hypothetical protein